VDLPESISGPKLLRLRDLYAHGMDREAVQEALKAGILVRPTAFSDKPEHGVYATAISMSDEYLPDLPDAMIAFLFEGQAIYHGQYAAMRHGLATSLSGKTQILLPAATRVKERDGIDITRTRRQAALTEGIDEITTLFGISYKITSKARTVIDLMRARNRSDDDWRHAMDAMSSYLDEGGDQSELIRLSHFFENWLHPIIETALHSSSRGYSL